MDGLSRFGNSLESIQFVVDVLAILFRQCVFPGRILHFADVDDVVGPVDEQVDLRALSVRFICEMPPGTYACPDAADLERPLDLAYVHETDALEREALPG